MINRTCPIKASGSPTGRRLHHRREPGRFARDLTVQLTGHDFLRSLGVSLIPATTPELRASRLSLRRVSVELAARGHLTANGRPYVATACRRCLTDAAGRGHKSWGGPGIPGLSPDGPLKV